MYKSFMESIIPIREQNYEEFDLVLNIGGDILNFFKECGGYSFNDGLYRTFLPASSLHWAIIISNYFPKYKSKIIPFGYDWMGRQFSVDISRSGFLLMFDPSTAEAFEMKGDLLSFHIDDLVHDRSNTLSEDIFHNTVKKLGLERVNYTDCVGFKTPLFLGGTDNLNNYEIVDVEVYWEIQCQIYQQIKDMPTGTKINSIKIK